MASLRLGKIVAAFFLGICIAALAAALGRGSVPEPIVNEDPRERVRMMEYLELRKRMARNQIKIHQVARQRSTQSRDIAVQ
jgi:hypothetical protein